MKILAADDERAVHFGRDNSAGKDTSSYGNIASERALLVWPDIALSVPYSSKDGGKGDSEGGIQRTNIGSLYSGLRGLEAQSNVFVPSSATLSHSLALCALGFRVEEDMRLLLKGTL